MLHNQDITCMHSGKAQIFLSIKPLRAETTLCTQYVARDLQIISAKTDLTGRMFMLIREIARHSGNYMVLLGSGIICSK